MFLYLFAAVKLSRNDCNSIRVTVRAVLSITTWCIVHIFEICTQITNTPFLCSSTYTSGVISILAENHAFPSCSVIHSTAGCSPTAGTYFVLQSEKYASLFREKKISHHKVEKHYCTDNCTVLCSFSFPIYAYSQCGSDATF